MKLKTKLALTTLLAALLPLAIAMAVSLWHSSEQVRLLTIDSARGYLRTGAEILSEYFAQRVSEISTYANMPLVRTMDWKKIGPFLRKELERHGGKYEKLAIGNKDSHYYSTSGGNPAYGGLTSFDNSDPNAKLKSMAKRMYWRYTVGDNPRAEPRTYVSDPMISYTTGVRQVLVGATILSESGDEPLGLVGGTIQWKEIESLINRVRDDILREFGRSAKLCLVTQNGVYTYHWDPDKVIHLKLDADGKPVLNEIGEKVSVRIKITEEPSEELARAGRDMVMGGDGFAFFTDLQSGKEMAIIYAPVRSANYSMAIVVPKDQIMAPVRNLRWSFLAITLLSIILAVIVSLLIARRVTKPLEALNTAAKELAKGNLAARLAPKGSDEVGELTHTFNEMRSSLQAREEALKASEEKYRTILESIQEGYYEVDIAGNLTFFNDSLCKILGYPRDEMTGMNDRQYTDKENARKLFQTFNRVYRTGESAKAFDWEIIRKDGTRRYVEASVSLIKDPEGPPTGFRGIVRDVTERREMEAELLKTKNFLQNILNSSIDGITTTDLGGNIISFSRRMLEMLGYTEAELIGEKVYHLYGNHLEDAKAIMKELTTKGELRNHEMRLRTKGGELLDINISASLLRDERGKVIGTLGIFRDITEKKQLEARLQRAQKMEAIGTLAGGVAHDLNNILAGIVSYPELLLMKLPQDSPLRGSILTIQKSGEKAAAIVQDLLTLARRGVVVTEVVNLNQVINEYLKSPEFEKLKKHHPGVRVETHLDPTLLNIMGSPAHLSKTIMNLTSNAAEAMPGGGTILISTENQYIDKPIKGYDAVKEGDYITLTVSDTGTGISSEDIGRIFEPFYTKKEMGRSGTGLGMTVVWGTVKDHNGYIDVQSIEGKGTTFILYFPITRKDLHGDATGTSVQDYKGNGESILVVDDVEEQRQIALGMLKELGYSVTSVSSGEEAIDYLKDNSVDLVVLDMIMDPGMDGLETYKRILKIHPGQKAIIVSGFSETRRVKEAQKLGAGSYVKKPFLLEKIGAAVKAELDK